MQGVIGRQGAVLVVQWCGGDICKKLNNIKNKKFTIDPKNMSGHIVWAV